MKKDLISISSTPETFQELGFFGSIKEDKWNSFLHAVGKNIFNSRKETGNISFSLFQPEDGKLEPIWFERFENKAAHNHHKQQDYFKEAIKVIQTSLKGEARSIELEQVDEIPAALPTLSDKPKTTRHVVVLYDVKPEKRQSFIDATADVAPLFRQAQGNLEFNLYQYATDPNRFVLMEGWESIADHEAQLKLNHTKKLNAAIEGFCVSNPMANWWILKDISLEN